MGMILENHGRIGIEVRRKSFTVHPSNGYSEDGERFDESLGKFGKHWREGVHPEFMLDDIDDLISALEKARDYAVARKHGT